MFTVSVEKFAKSPKDPFSHPDSLPRSFKPCIEEKTIDSCASAVFILIRTWLRPWTHGSVSSETSYGYLS